MRKNIAAGNWKMNTKKDEAILLYESLNEKMSGSEQCEVIVFPPAIHIGALQHLANNKIKLGIQNVSNENSGAFTGEIAGNMLSDYNVSHALVGHSERRQLFNETDETLAKKINALLAIGVTPVFCCGEPLSERKNGNHIAYVKSQLNNSLNHLSSQEFEKLIIAYEPIWAIGTGETASPEQAQEIHAFIRNWIAEKYNDTLANSTSILYGGSVKPGNAKELFSQADVDGGLVGGASLKANDFYEIIQSF